LIFAVSANQVVVALIAAVYLVNGNNGEGNATISTVGGSYNLVEARAARFPDRHNMEAAAQRLRFEVLHR
jgi:hypothetical protein